MIKQLLSSSNYASPEGMTWAKWVKGYAKALKNPSQTIEYMKKIPYLKARFEAGGQNEFLKNEISNSKLAKVAKLKEFATMNIRLGDIGAIAFGGKPYLEYLINEKKLSEDAAISEFLDHTQLIDSKASVNYCQGLDARFIDDDISKLLCQTKIKMVHFAFDLIKNEEKILKGLKIFAKYFNKDDRSKRVYILTNYNSTIQEDYYRTKKVIELGYSPYIMIYQKGTQPQFLTDLARWANSMFLYRSTTFADYTPRTDGKTMKTLHGSIIN